MNRALAVVGLGIAAEAVRLSLLGRLPGHPDFLLGIVVLVALGVRPPAGAATGLVLGGLRDLLYGFPVGVEAAALALVGWSVGSVGKSIYREAAITQAVMMLLGGLGHGAFVYLMETQYDPSGLLLYLVKVSLPSAVITATVVPVIYHFVPRKRPRMLTEREKKILLEQQ